ncbi:PREDICTED: uncharacterized protein LOC108354219 [Rhagoletis zephyria]|uniref:uncharacterized protein LOC108354219 n=1 Tax=Rhagoletis zephyria TaxID=28612 RepID=UPI00081179FF|nr:PREDICTED: uncharacterized protein LOC108354219 [Rhagoletis zephyria]
MVAGALTSLTSEVKELHCSASIKKGKIGRAKNTKQTAEKQNNNTKHPSDELSNNNAESTAVTADKVFADKNVVSTGNINDVLHANAAEAYSAVDLSRTAAVIDVTGEKSINSITPNDAATASLPSYANVHD